MASEAKAFQKMLDEGRRDKAHAFLIGLRKRISSKSGPNGKLVFTRGKLRAERDESGKWTFNWLDG